MNLWMESLDASIHDFREFRVTGHINHRNAGKFQKLSRAPCRQDFKAQLRETAHESIEACFIADTDKGTPGMSVAHCEIRIHEVY